MNLPTSCNDNVAPGPAPDLASTVIGLRDTAELHRLLSWCRARSGPEATGTGLAGDWCWSWLSGDDVLITAACEVIFELHMLEPWRLP